MECFCGIKLTLEYFFTSGSVIIQGVPGTRTLFTGSTMPLLYNKWKGLEVVEQGIFSIRF